MTTARPVPTRVPIAGALLALVLALVACGTEPTGVDGALAPVWDRATVLATLDLSELGDITVADDGTFLLGGKRLPDGLPRDLAHGRDLNLLRVDDETLDRVPTATRDALLFADPDTMRAHLETAGLDAATVRAALADGVVEAREVRAVLRDRAADDPLRAVLTTPGADR